MHYTLENFINYCDEYQIANEAFEGIKSKIITLFSKIVLAIEKKVKQMKDGKIKSVLMRLLSRAKTGLSKSKSLNEKNPEMVKQLQEEANNIQEELKEIKEEKESNEDKDNKKDEVSPYVKECVDNNNTEELKYWFGHCLNSDPTFDLYRHSYNYAKQHCDGFPEEHIELTPFINNKLKWNRDYLVNLELDYLRNASDERFQHMIKVAKVIHAKKIKNLLKERQK